MLIKFSLCVAVGSFTHLARAASAKQPENSTFVNRTESVPESAQRLDLAFARADFGSDHVGSDHGSI
jgi:hypothetical protein